MTFHPETPRPMPVLIDRPGPFKGLAVAAHVPVLDDDQLVFGIIASETAEAQLVAMRVAELLNAHGLAEIPDDASEVADA